MSLAGMMLHASADPARWLAEGDELLLGFQIPEGQWLLGLKARIVWKRQGMKNLLGSWAFGVEFYDTSESEIRKLLDPAAAVSAPMP